MGSIPVWRAKVPCAVEGGQKSKQKKTKQNKKPVWENRNAPY